MITKANLSGEPGEAQSSWIGQEDRKEAQTTDMTAVMSSATGPGGVNQSTGS
jgi:hypothetical protein